MYSIVTVTPQTAEFVYDLTTAAEVSAELGSTVTEAQVTAASKMIASMCDRVFAAQNVTEEFRMDWCAYRSHVLNLSRFPVIGAVESVAVNDVALTSDDYDVDAIAGLLYRRRGVWAGRVTVVYSGGYDLPDEAPASLARACIELVKSQKSSERRDSTIRSISDSASSVSFFEGSGGGGTGAVPLSVSELIQPFKRLAV